MRLMACSSCSPAWPFMGRSTGMRFTIQRKARTPTTTSASETAISIQLGQ